MKKTILTLISATLSFLGSAQITELPNGNVGIGYNNPDSKLRIQGTHSLARFKTNIDGNFEIQATRSNTSSLITNLLLSSQNHIILNPNVLGTTGNVGIGTNDPSAILDIEKNLNGNTILEITNKSNGTSARRGISIGNGTSGNSVYLLSTSSNYNQVNSWSNSGVLGTDSQLLNGLILRSSVGKIRFQPGGITDRIVFTENGSVGIGTTNPEHLLQLHNSVNPTLAIGKLNTNNGGKSSLSFFAGNGTVANGFTVQYNKDTTNDKLSFLDGGNKEVFSILKSTSPQINIGKLNENTQGKSSLSFYSGNGSTSNSFSLQYHKTTNTDRLSFIDGGNIETLSIINGGYIGIGTINPGSWKLAVNGKIRAKEIKVETGWSDFVFYDDYKLPSLLDVENHIKEKGHLKDIPSAKQVAKDGIFLGEMDSKLLQKIEELTLYTIQQEKKIKKLEEENKELKSLSNRLTEIEKILNSKK